MKRDVDNDRDADLAGTDRAHRPGPHRFAVLATLFTWPLLFVGGLVTTYRVGMAVPDWPTTFGMNMFLYDMTTAPWGVFGEHAHRLYGAAVGIFTILLMIDFLIFERRRSLKALGVVALLAVVAQGFLGGLRVRYNSTLLAAVHGVKAEAFFGLMVALCVLTGRSWAGSARAAAGVGKVRRQAVAMLGLVALMVGLGAWLRHYPAVLPLRIHAVAAVLVLGHGAGLVAGLRRRRAGFPELMPATVALATTLALQVALGVAAWWLLRPYDGIARPVTLFQALIRTGHQANAGLLLASTMVLTLRACGQLAESPGRDRPSGNPARELEAVA